ncbi:MAG: hypothetical protein OYG32_07250 [Rhodospirillaceae bacterium]|nr:hypothetical protein [Rhodospirillaceae bacterium]
MEIASLVLSAGGIVLSLIALYKANSARKAVSQVIAKKDIQEDRQRLLELITSLNEAKKVALAIKSATHDLQRIGITGSGALHSLELAEDALRTRLPISWDQDEKEKFVKSADELQSAIAVISGGLPPRTGWKAALVVLQRVIPMFEAEERKLANASLNPNK